MAKKKLNRGNLSEKSREPFYNELYGDTFDGQLVNLKRKTLKKVKDQNDDLDEKNQPNKINNRDVSLILNLAREQLGEIEEQNDINKSEADKAGSVRFDDTAVDNDSKSEGSVEDSLDSDQDGITAIDISPEDEEIFRRFAPHSSQIRHTLTEVVMKKLDEAGNFSSDSAKSQHSSPNKSSVLPDDVIEVYKKVGTILSRYKSGNIPKVFSLVPHLANWKEIVYFTRPDQWTPQATYMAVKIFIENFEDSMIPYFIRDIILVRIRDEIQKNKKLNYHLYRALKKTAYRPSALYKGIVIPLSTSGTCTLREAAIVGSALSKISVPVLHSAACIFKLSTLPYSGGCSLLLRVLIDKKYALPYKVIDALVDYHRKMKDIPPPLPVLWYQSLLVLCQRYKNDLLQNQKEILLDLMKTHNHKLISPEIRRELRESIKSRDTPTNNDNLMDFQPALTPAKIVSFAL